MGEGEGEKEVPATLLGSAPDPVRLDLRNRRPHIFSLPNEVAADKEKGMIFFSSLSLSFSIPSGTVSSTMLSVNCCCGVPHFRVVGFVNSND